MALPREAVALAGIETRPVPSPESPPGERFLAVALDPAPLLEGAAQLRALREQRRRLEAYREQLQGYQRALSKLGDAVSRRRRLELARELGELEGRLAELKGKIEALSRTLRERYGLLDPKEGTLLQVAISSPRPLRLKGHPLLPLAPARYPNPLLPFPGHLYLAREALPYGIPLWVSGEGEGRAYPLPREALVFYGGRRWLFQKEGPGRYRLRPVEVVVEEGERVWVRGPLRGEVVVRGAALLLGELLRGMIPAEEGKEEE